MNKKNENLKVVLSGTRRQYLINELNKINVEYKYFEMADLELLNKLYNILDLYLSNFKTRRWTSSYLGISNNKNSNYFN